jgi:hypothetical protein
MAEYLDLATQAYQAGAINLGWGFLHRAGETEVLLMERPELDAAAVALAAECAGGKIPGWRRDAIRGLLARMHVSPFPELNTEARSTQDKPRRAHGVAHGVRSDSATLRDDRLLVREALAVRNGYSANTYTSLAITAHRRLWLMLLRLVVLGAVLFGIAQAPDLDPQPTGDLPPSSVLAPVWVPLTMACLGALGSVVSAIQRLAVDPLTGPVPAQLGSFTATVTRPLIGAVAALTVFLAARGGLAVPEAHPVPLLLLAAFTAGLTERLVVYREGGGSRNRPATSGQSPP